MLTCCASRLLLPHGTGFIVKAGHPVVNIYLVFILHTHQYTDIFCVQSCFAILSEIVRFYEPNNWPKNQTQNFTFEFVSVLRENMTAEPEDSERCLAGVLYAPGEMILRCCFLNRAGPFMLSSVCVTKCSAGHGSHPFIFNAYSKSEPLADVCYSPPASDAQ